jgi:tetratricopeptide (TPR) repeat protein
MALPAIALLPVAAFGEPQKSAPVARQGQSETHDPDNITAISQYMATIVKGNERFVAKDYTAAIDTYKKAVQLSPRNALAHYLLTETYLTQGNVGEAEASIREAQEVSDNKNPALRSRVLFLSADIFERQKKWDQAKTAWQAYADHVAKFADAGFPQTGVERLKAIQKVLDLEKAYVAVRERIAAEKAADAGKKK